MRYVRAVLRHAAAGRELHSRSCCARMVWPTERFRHAPNVCAELLSTAELAREAAIDAAVQSQGGLPVAKGKGRRGGARGRRAVKRAVEAASASAR